MQEYHETVDLCDGSKVTVRDTSRADLEEAYEFFRSVPDEERQYLRIDVCDREVLSGRYEKIEAGKAIRLIAECRGKIVGEATLETMRYGWLRKSGEVRLLILPKYRDHGLEQVLAREVFLLAARLGLHTLIARVMDSQKGTFETFSNLHFDHVATQKDQAIDVQGRLHDVHLLTFSLRKMWGAMEDAIGEANTMPLRNYY